MTPTAPILHTFDPQIAGKIGLYIDPPGLIVGDQVAWYVSTAPGGSYTQVASTYVHGNGLDALSTVFDAATPFYCVAKASMAGSWSTNSNEVSAALSDGMTQVQHLEAALGGTYNPGSKVDAYTAITSKTVNADGTIS